MAGELIQERSLVELEGAGGGCVIVADGKVQRKSKCYEGDRERTPLHQLALVGQQGQQDRTRKRDEDDDGQDGVVDVHCFLWWSKTTWFVKQVRVSLVQPDRAAEDHNQQDGGGPESEPAGIGANVAGLNAAYQ